MLREFGVAPSASACGARYGHDRVAGIDMVIFEASSILMSAAPRWEWGLGFRALGRVGAGLFFSTAGAVLVALRPIGCWLAICAGNSWGLDGGSVNGAS
jgi:MFS family permease